MYKFSRDFILTVQVSTSCSVFVFRWLYCIVCYFQDGFILDSVLSLQVWWCLFEYDLTAHPRASQRLPSEVPPIHPLFFFRQVSDKSTTSQTNRITKWEVLYYDKSVNKIKSISQFKEATSVSSNSTPLLKKEKLDPRLEENAEHDPSFQEDLAQRDLDQQYLETILPDVLKSVQQAGVMYEFREFHQMLAESTFPLDNTSFLCSSSLWSGNAVRD